MVRKISAAARPVALVLCAVAIPFAGSAQTGELTAQLVKTGLYVISGGGCNSVVRLSQNGLILVDGKLPGNYEELVKRAGKLAFKEQPVRALILTDHLERHAGNNAEFLEDGTQIIAQENVKANMEASKPSGGRITLPTFTFSSDYILRLGGVEVQLFHFGSAHTSGDTVVYFPNLKVVAVGDLYSQSPDPDYAAGGSLMNWGTVLAQILKLDFDVVVPGTGTGVSRAGFEAYKTRIDTLVARAAALVKEGVSQDQFPAKLKTGDPGGRLNFSSEQFDHFYAELSMVNGR